LLVLLLSFTAHAAECDKSQQFDTIMKMIIETFGVCKQKPATASSTSSSKNRLTLFGNETLFALSACVGAGGQHVPSVWLGKQNFFGRL